MQLSEIKGRDSFPTNVVDFDVWDGETLVAHVRRPGCYDREHAGQLCLTTYNQRREIVATRWTMLTVAAIKLQARMLRAAAAAALEDAKALAHAAATPDAASTITADTVRWAASHDWFQGGVPGLIYMRDVATAKDETTLLADGYGDVREYAPGCWSGERTLRFTSRAALRAAAGY